MEQSASAQGQKAVMRTLTLAFLAVCAPVLAQTNYGTITFTNKSGEPRDKKTTPKSSVARQAVAGTSMPLYVPRAVSGYAWPPWKAE